VPANASDPAAVLSTVDPAAPILLTPRRRWLIPAALGVVGAAVWLRTPSVAWLAAVAAAVAATMVLGRWAERRQSPRVIVSLGVLFLGVATWQQVQLTTIATQFDAWAAHAVERGDAIAARALPIAAEQVRRLASRALDAPVSATAAFPYLAALDGVDARTSVVLYRNGVQVAWAGEPRAIPVALRGAIGVERLRFYLVLYAAARRGDAVAVSTLVLDADPPARHLVNALGADLARRASVGSVEFAPPGPADESGFRPWILDGDTMLRYRATAPTLGSAMTRQLERARGMAGAVLAAWALALLLTAWRRKPSLAEQLGALSAGAMVVGLVPLGALSNVSWIFDPSLYFVRIAGVTLAGLASLVLSGALLTLAGLALQRATPRYQSRVVPALVLLGLVVLGPFLLRALGAGITLPATGTPTTLWLAWQIGIFLFAVVVLLGGAAAGRALWRATRGVDPMLGPSLAVIAAALAPQLWTAEYAWNDGYTVLWIGVIAATALARPSRWSLLQVGTVAALGATVLTWGAVMRRTVELAELESARLTAPDPEATELLKRFAAQLDGEPAPRTRADLLDRISTSDLVARYPLTAATWQLDGKLLASLDVFGQTEELDVRQVVETAVRSGRPAISDVIGYPGVYQVLAVPFADSTVSTVIVEPRSRSLATPAVAALLGYSSPTAGAPPYRFELGEVQADRRQNDGMRWVRDRGGYDGSRVVPTVLGPLQAHARIDVPTGWSLVQRGTLLVVADLAVLFGLAAAAGLTRAGAWRWWRLRRRSLRGSYRLQLTVVLLLFFVAPLSVLTLWSFQRLRADDAEKRELLVREFLRAVDRSGERPELEQASRRIGVPLIGYSFGRLVDVSDELFGLLAPVGLFLPPNVAQSLSPGGTLTATGTVNVAGTNVLLSYLSTRGARGERIVVAAPAVLEEDEFNRRREDLVMLLLFGAVSGVAAALWLSGRAARQFARPIGVLRDAAVAVAAGERAPRLDQAPPSEFVPVFDAFRTMADDLRASERALDAARRRTDAVLRTVASGVVALDGDVRVVLANPRAEALLGAALPAGTLLATVAPSLARYAAAFGASTKRDDAFEEAWGDATVQGRFTRLDSGGVVVTLDDVTQLARAQRVLAWGEMARQVAHEIKNPLTPIRLGVQHLRRARDDGRADFDAILDRNVGTILTQIDRLDEIARAFSRYGTSPERAAAAEPTDVIAVVQEVLALEKMAEDTVEWRLQLPEVLTRAERLAMARAPELRDVLLNLLENARQAGATRVTVGAHVRGDAWHLQVQDNGTGIAPDALPRVFEPHFSTRTSGSGLGLAISRRLVDGWGGTLTISSSSPDGTVVAMTLRRATDPGVLAG
jgi:two-component system, NtrC family, nitrogen regulation sensor histidine kinase NtrY